MGGLQRVRVRRTLAALLFASVACANSLVGHVSAAVNVLLIAIDDLSSEAVSSVSANELADTPHLDAWMADGVVFENHQVQVPICGASRASMLSSRRPDDTNIKIFECCLRKDKLEVQTLPEMFRSAGYWTQGHGKIFDQRTLTKTWTGPAWKKQDKCASSKSTQCSWDNFGYGPSPRLFRGAKEKLVYEVDPDSFKLADRTIANKGIAFLESNQAAEQPWFLALGFHLPHIPFILPKGIIAEFGDASLFDDSIEAYDEAFWEGESQSFTFLHQDQGAFSAQYKKNLFSTSPAKAKRAYFASVKSVDYEIQRVREALAPHADNTVVVFWSDHGFGLYDHGVVGKWNLLESSTKSLLAFVAPPALFPDVQAGSRSAAPVESIDIKPTLAQLALDAAFPGRQPGGRDSGVSLVPILTGERRSVKAVALSQYNAQGPGAVAVMKVNGKKKKKPYLGYALRSFEYKMILYRDPHAADFTALAPAHLAKIELYHVAAHGGREMVNVFDDPDHLHAREALLELWASASPRMSHFDLEVPFDEPANP